MTRASVRLLAGVFAGALVGCSSPEAKRVRGAADGADVHNRKPVVEMHAGSDPYYRTPCLLPDDECTEPSPDRQRDRS